MIERLVDAAHAGDLGAGGACVAALLRGDTTEHAEAGAMLVAEALYIFRTINTKG